MAIIKMVGFDAQLSHKPIKHIYVRIDRQGNVKVSAPMTCTLAYIRQFLQDKHAWIVAHQDHLRKHGMSVNQSFQSGEQHLFLGQPYSLMIHEHTGQSRVAIEGKHLCCYVKSAANQDTHRALLTKWQTQQMELLLPTFIQKWEVIVGVNVNQWRIRIMKTRWGSCQPSKKIICLNLHLIQYPLVCLEYVVVHELVHILEASHNQRFYALMNQFMPKWKDYKRILHQGAHPYAEHEGVMEPMVNTH